MNLRGKRFKRLLQLVSDKSAFARLTVLALVKEPLRYLHGFFLRCAGRPRQPVKHPWLSALSGHLSTRSCSTTDNWPSAEGIGRSCCSNLSVATLWNSCSTASPTWR